MSAKKVFSAVIICMKGTLLKQIEQRDLGSIDGMEHYVITEPAISNDSYKQFMRKAVEKVCYTLSSGSKIHKFRLDLKRKQIIGYV